MTENLELNGVPLESVGVGLLRASSYGHFTSMQIRDGRVRGLGHHLERLDNGSRELFGVGLSGDRVLSYLRAALDRADSADLSVRVNAFRGPQPETEPNVLVTVTDPIEPTRTPPRLLAVEHERPVPQLKHTGTFSLLYHRDRARDAGYGDAVFFDRAGRISEATIWNICFGTCDRIVWPSAAVLPGITMLTLQQAMTATGVPAETRPVPLTELGSYDAAYLTNSIDPALPVASITGPLGTTTFDQAHTPTADLITKSTAAVPLDAI